MRLQFSVHPNSRLAGACIVFLRRPLEYALVLWWHLRCYAALATARRDTFSRIRCASCKRILVVCYGNIYRSPFVAAVLRKRLSKTPGIRSAGFHPIIGRPSPPAHVAMAARLGVDLESHRSQVVTSVDIAWADTFILMDRRNWQELRRLGADPNKFVWLGAMDGKPEIPDPYGMPEIEAWKVVQRLHRCTEALVAAIDAQGRLLP